MLKLLTDGQPAPSEKLIKPASKVYFIQKVIKGETYLVMAQSAIEIEDEFSSLYYSASSASNLFLMPPFEPNVLMNLTQTNNILLQCIEAMEVNIDGTGYEFVGIEKDKDPEKAELKAAEAFFGEPYPNLSFVSIRRKLRRQMESVGYGFLEVLRNMNKDIVGLRNIETPHVRMVKLDAPILVKKKIERDGHEVELQMWERERRFAQMVALKTKIYYREFGTTREIDRETGDWETDEKKVPPEKLGTELMMFGVHPDYKTPYYLPRWINQLPSVVGSRNAEEQNLQFLDAGGMPPAIVFIQGGTLIKDASDQLKMYLSGMNKNKNRAVVVEVQSSSGSLDTTAKVDVKVERFGAERAQDAMFMKYDAATEEHVRTGFRLPPLFLGKAADYNFATAQTSYMVAEAQVFAPERTEFDEFINKTIVKEMKWKSLKLKSKPITLKDVTAALKSMELAKDVATRESYIKEINTISGASLQLAPVPHPNVSDGQVHPGKPTVAEIDHKELPASTKPAVPSSPQPEPKPEPDSHVVLKPGDKMMPMPAKGKMAFGGPKKKKAAMELIELAHDYAVVQGLVKKQELSPARALLVKEEIEELTEDDERAFNTLLAQYAFGSDDPDLVAIVANGRV